MHPSFNIRSANDYPAHSHLLVEIGQQGISFVVKEENKMATVVCYHFEKDDIAGQLQEILAAENLLDRSFTKTDICWAFPQSVLVPNEFFNSSATKETLELVYGDNTIGDIRTDFLFRHNMHNIYRIDTDVTNVVAAKFPYANHSHVYSLLPDMTEQKGKQLSVIFYPRQLTATLLHDGNIQLVQSFAYENGKDAAYHLLNICQQFHCAPDDTVVHLSGMIDERSNLYSELYKYFLQLHFNSLPDQFEYSDEIKQQPTHFFSHLFLAAACV